MADPIKTDSPAGSVELATWAAFTAATTLEQQIAIMLGLLQLKETDYNRANPTLTPLNRVVVGPDYEASQVNYTVDLLLGSDAVQNSLQDSIVPHVPVS